jgi:imidazole glycerol-phosphate synthase subunit HisF
MLLRRVIPCLDVKDGRVVKGVRFVDLSDEGDPPTLAERYAAAGADEIVFLDISAAPESRGTLLEVVERTARRVFVPLTVGGGVRSSDEMRDVLRAGADKVAINTAAIRDPSLLGSCARRFGRQCVVVSVDARQVQGAAGASPAWEVVIQGGRQATGMDAIEWISRAVDLGAGEVLLTSIDRDGTRAGFDLALLRAATDAVDVPVVASGGAGSPADMVAAIMDGHADAVLAASIFHRDIHSIAAVKEALAAAGVPVRRAAAAGVPGAAA